MKTLAEIRRELAMLDLKAETKGMLDELRLTLHMMNARLLVIIELLEEQNEHLANKVED